MPSCRWLWKSNKTKNPQASFWAFGYAVFLKYCFFLILFVEC